MNALTVHIRGDNSQLQATLNKTQRALAGLGVNLKTAFAGLGGLGAATAGFLALKSSISKAAEMQDFETSFSTLLGGADKAQKRLAELSKFAATTPFELQNSVKASKVLQTLTNGALATGKGLRMVGDVAASTGEPFEELAVHFGRLYSGLKNGAPAGEAMSRLQELGVLSAETRQKLEGLQKQGQKGAGLWKIATNDFARFAGEMDKRSKTWNGLWSNLQDNIGAAFREFGKPLVESLSPFLKQTVDFMEKVGPMAKAAGASIGASLSLAFQAFKDGSVGEILQASLTLGFKKAINFLWSALVGTFKATFQLGQEMARGMVMHFKQITNPDLWKGLGSLLAGVAIRFGAAILGSFQDAMVTLQAGMQWIATKLKNGLTMAVEGPIATLKAGVAFFMQEILAGLRKIPGMSKLIGEGDGKDLTYGEMREQKKQEARAQSDPLDNTSFAEMKAQIRKDGGATLYGANAGKLNSAANSMMDSGAALLKPLIEERLDFTKGLLQNVGKQFMSGFDGPAFLDTSKDQARLDTVMDRTRANLRESDEKNKRAATMTQGGPQKVKFKVRHDDEEDAKGRKGGAGVITSDLARVGGGGLAAGGTVGIFRSMEGHLKKIAANTARQQGALTSGNLAGRNGSGLRTFSLTSPLSMPVTRIGNHELTEQPGRKTTRDYFGVWTIRTTYACKVEKLLDYMPSPLSKHKVFPFCLLTEVTGVEEEGDTALIECEYRGLKETESVHRITIVPSTSDDPIETHYKYANLTQDEHKYIRDYLDSPKGVVTVQDLSPTGLALLEKKIKGTEAFINQGLTVRDTYYRKTTFPRIRPIEIAAAPTGSPALPTGAGLNFNWLFIPGSGEVDGGCVRVEDEYRLSGPRGWDTDIYLP